MIIDNDNLLDLGVPYFQRSQCWWALVQCVMIQCKILMFIFAIRIHVEYTFPNDGFPTANNLRIQIRAVTVESSFAKSQHLAGCFTFPLRFTKKSRQHKNPQQAVKFRFHLAPRKKANLWYHWNKETRVIPPITLGGSSLHQHLPWNGSAKMPRFHHDPVLVKPNDCWASHHFRSSNDPIHRYIYIYT